jgi:ATP-binding cassette subfamily F protein 3
LRIGYFAQHQVEQLRLDESAMWHMQRLEPATRDQALRDFLGSFDFRGERASSPVRDFSGGEKARLTLALLARQKPNLLLLDEPTNHLDIDMREALTEALQDYTGALIVVAHDRHLLRATADELWLVAEGSVSLFDGDLDDYRRWVLTGRTQEDASVAHAGGAPPAADRRTQKRAEAAARQRMYALRKPLADKLARIEKELEAIGVERQAIEAWLTKPDAYGEEGKHALRDTIARQGDLTWQLARLEAEWLEVSEALQKIGS